MNKYNGRSNRDTFLVDIYFTDDFLDYTTTKLNVSYYDLQKVSNVEEIAKHFKDFVVQEIKKGLDGVPDYLYEFIDSTSISKRLNNVNWHELANLILERVNLISERE